MEEIKVDLVVIGSGPSGQKAAIQGAKLGKSVVVIEKELHPGGSCLFSGTIPSKTLREAIVNLTDFNNRSFYGQGKQVKEVSIQELNYRLKKVLEEEKNMVIDQFRRNQIRLIQGSARFENEHQLMVTDDEYRIKYQIVAQYVVIATGSKPRTPIEIPFDNEYIVDSTQLLALNRVPKSMIVLGGGIIGSEYASFFAALGCQVTIIDKRDHILPSLDSEIGMHLQKALTDIGLKVLPNKEPGKIEREEGGAKVIFKDGGSIQGEVVLYALGRTANVDALYLKNIGITTDSKGYIPVNALFQTVIPHVYAVGDVIGGPCLGSTSMEQGRLAVRHAFSMKAHYFPDVYPMGIYSIPEISTCGYTEDELKSLGFRYEVGRAYYHEIARGHIDGSTVGLFKILFHAETLQILGIHVIGRGATEVIHIGQVAMNFRAKIDFFVDQIFNYPTYAEGYRVAALNGLNKIK
ncbi:MAG: Si-specific NAD(P)(+) transhydrogenase [Chlamydia sp.]